MTNWTFAGSGPSRIPITATAPITLDTQGTWLVKNLSVDNGTALILDIEGPDGSIYQIVPPYQSRVFTTLAWTGFKLAIDSANIATIQATDILNIFASDIGSPPTYSSYGPASWGGGGVPNSLVNVLGGQVFLASQVQQLINLLTGVMTGQVVTVNNEIVAQGTTGGLQVKDRDGLGGDYFNFMLNGGVLFFFSSAVGSSPLTLDESDRLIVGGSAGQVQTNDRDGIGGDSLIRYFNAGICHWLGPNGDVMTLDETGRLIVLGTNAQMQVNDRDGVGGDNFIAYANAGLWRLLSSVAGQDLITISETGAVAPGATAATRIGAIVGADAQTLRNWAWVVPDGGVVASGAVPAGATNLAVTNFPSTNPDRATFMVAFRASVVGDVLSLFTPGDVNPSFVQNAVVANQNIWATVTMRVAQAANQVQYSVAGSGTFNLVVELLAYAEPT